MNSCGCSDIWHQTCAPDILYTSNDLSKFVLGECKPPHFDFDSLTLAVLIDFVISPIAIAYSMGQIQFLILLVCLSVSLSVRTLIRFHFLIHFRQK